MRVCPQCGFIDPPEWKHCKYSYHIDACTFENFKLLFPKLAENLKKGGDITEDANYYYRLTKKSLVVERKAKIEWTENRNPFGAEKYEKFNHGTRNIWEPHDLRHCWAKAHPDQTKLVSSIKTSEEKP